MPGADPAEYAISVAVALLLAAAVGYAIGDHRATQQARRPKTLQQLAREQGVKPFDPATFPYADPELFSDEDWNAWDAAIKEARGQ